MVLVLFHRRKIMSCHQKQYGCSNSGCCSSGGCGCGSSSCKCGGNSDHTQGHHSCEDIAHEFLELADEAWMEALKEKIKSHILLHDKKLDELAHLISETNHERWQRKMSKKRACAEYHEKLQGLFGTGGSCQSKR